MNIEKELQKVNITDTAIADLSEKYMSLRINGIDDKDGQKNVREALSKVKKIRTTIDKVRKDMTAEALATQRGINAEAKRVTALIEPIEGHLALEEKKIADEIIRLKREAEETQARIFQHRVTTLSLLDFKFDGIKYSTDYLDTFNEERIEIPTLLVKQWDEVTWKNFIDNARHYYEIDKNVKMEAMRFDQERRANDEAKRKAEQEQLAQERVEIAAEKARLDAIAKEQAEKEAALKAEEERISADKYRIDEKIREELEAAVIAEEAEKFIPILSESIIPLEPPIERTLKPIMTLEDITIGNYQKLVEFVKWCQYFKCETNLNYLFDEIEKRSRNLLKEIGELYYD